MLPHYSPVHVGALYLFFVAAPTKVLCSYFQSNLWWWFPSQSIIVVSYLVIVFKGCKEELPITLLPKNTKLSEAVTTSNMGWASNIFWFLISVSHHTACKIIPSGSLQTKNTAEPVNKMCVGRRALKKVIIRKSRNCSVAEFGVLHWEGDLIAAL